MKTLFEAGTRAEVLGRIAGLTPESPRQWGKMQAGQMVAHCADQLRLALGEIPSRFTPGPMSFPPLRHAILYWLPWPKGKAQAPPELFTTPPATWDADVATLGSLIGRFTAADPQAAWPVHPKFGPMSGRDWGVLAYRHLDHHLRQFGR
jgi:DinB superfamily